MSGAAGGVPIPPSAPVRPAAPTRALVPVEKTGPRSIPGADTPLGRSGVSLSDLLFAPDVLETREAVLPVAMDMGLESARGQLLRQLPGEALVSLDAVWARAQHGEEGWYLRSGALTLVGLPTEGDRVAGEGLVTQPASLALRLVQSVARALVGDLSGARAALAPAIDAAPDDPVLTAQQAVVLARQGHVDDALDELDRLSVLYADHPAFTWARAAVRSAQADRTRSMSTPLWDESEAPGAPEEGAPRVDHAPGNAGSAGAARPRTVADEAGAAEVTDAPPAAPSPDDPLAAWQGSGDAVESAFTRLGARVAQMRDDDVARTARLLLRACSSGGALASACTPEEAHAARSVLSSILVVVQRETGAPSPVTPLVAQLLPLLRGTVPAEGERAARSDVDRRLDEATRLLRRQGGSVPAPVRKLLQLLVDAVDAQARRKGDMGRDAAPAARQASAAGSAEPVVVLERDDRDGGPLIPLRLGLSLLTDTPAARAFERSMIVDGAPVPLPAEMNVRRTPDGTVIVGAELSGTGWGAAREVAASGAFASPPRDREGQSIAPVMAVLCVVAALGAAANGATPVAVALVAAALWFGLRRRGTR